MTDTSIVILEINKFKEDIEKAKNLANFIPDVSSADGYEKSKRVSLDIGKALTSLESARKDRKAYFLEGGRAVDLQAAEIKEELQALQLPHKSAYQELDTLRKEREAARVAELAARVERMANMAANMAESSSDEISQAVDDIRGDECLNYYEFPWR